jgi:hypothetical protein
VVEQAERPAVSPPAAVPAVAPTEAPPPAPDVASDAPADAPDAASEPPIAAPEPPAPEPEPTSVTPAVPDPPTAVAGPADALDRLRAQWPEIVEHISKHPPTKPLIAACRPISVEGNIVTLGFPEGQAFLKDVAERRRANLEEGIGQFLGRAVAVRCVATNLDLLPPVPGDEEAAFVLAEARRIFADDLADVGEVS